MYIECAKGHNENRRINLISNFLIKYILEAKLVEALIKKVSKMIRESNHEDCTQYFKYDKCC